MAQTEQTYELGPIHTWMRSFSATFALQAVSEGIGNGFFIFEFRFLDGREIITEDVFAFDLWLANNRPPVGQLLGTDYSGEPRRIVKIFGTLC